VVAAEHEDGHRQRCQQLPDALVLAGSGSVREVARDEDCVRAGLELEDRADPVRERLRRIAVPLADVDVRVAELS
jgi:hypothetical protein